MCPPVHADPSPPGETEEILTETFTFKFTPSYYATTNQPGAYDLNLGALYGTHAIWLGYYQQSNEFEQARTGHEYTMQIPFVQLVPSLQVATHDFVGGAINAQVGDSIFAILGFGRTNLHEYYNLNFDPNDAITYGVGTSLLPNSMPSLSQSRTTVSIPVRSLRILYGVYWSATNSDGPLTC